MIRNKGVPALSKRMKVTNRIKTSPDTLIRIMRVTLSTATTICPKVISSKAAQYQLHSKKLEMTKGQLSYANAASIFSSI